VPKYVFLNAISYKEKSISIAGNSTCFDGLGNLRQQTQVLAVGKKEFSTS